MSNRTTISTSHSKIFNYWKDKCIDENGNIHIEGKYPYEKSVEVVYDWGEPCCWCCRTPVPSSLYENPKYEEYLNEDCSKIYNLPQVKSYLQRCHIIPNCLGGSSAPSNLFLLCPSCHRDSPDTINPQMFFKYIYEERKNGGRINRIIKADKELRKDLGCALYFMDTKNIKIDKNIIGMHSSSFAHKTLEYSEIVKDIEYYKVISNMFLKDIINLDDFISTALIGFFGKNYIDNHKEEKASPFIDIINAILYYELFSKDYKTIVDIISALESTIENDAPIDSFSKLINVRKFEI